MPVKTIKIDEYHSEHKQMYQCIKQNINLDKNKQMPVKTIKIDEYHSGRKQMYQCINNKTSI